MTADEEQEWLDEQEQEALRYLETEQVAVDDALEIEWCVAPCVALWRARREGGCPVWVISGDLPTDLVADPSIKHAREAMRSIGSRWLEVAASLMEGKQHPETAIGRGLDEKHLKELGKLLKARAVLLSGWVESDRKWSEGEA